MEITRADLNEFKQDVTSILRLGLDQQSDVMRQELKVVAHQIKQDIVQIMDDKLRLNNDLIFQEIRASEHRQDRKLEAAEQRILSGVAQILDDAVIPQMAELDTRVAKLEVKASAL